MTAAPSIPLVGKRSRDFSKTDGIPNERWALAEVIYAARIREAWGKGKDTTPPEREGYFYRGGHADFDLALACAKAILAAYRVEPLEGQQ